MIKPVKKVFGFTLLNTALVVSGCAYQPQADQSPELEPSSPVPQAIEPIAARPNTLIDGASFFHVLLAELAVLKQRPDVALELFLTALEDHPSDPELLQRAAPLAARLGNPQLALILYQNWAEAAPQNPQTWQGLWQIALNQQSPEAAGLAIKNLLRLNPGTDLNIPYLTLVNWSGEDALTLYQVLTQNGLDLNERNEGLKLLGLLLHQAEQIDAAQAYWNRLAQNLTTAEALLDAAQQLFDLELFEASWTLLTYHPEPTESTVLVLKARTLQQQNEPEMALELLMPHVHQGQVATDVLALAAELAMQTNHAQRDAWLQALLETSQADSARLMLAQLAIAEHEYDAARLLLEQIRDVTLGVEASEYLISTLVGSPLPAEQVDALFEQWRHDFANGSMQIIEQQARYWYDQADYERAYDGYSLGLRINPNDFFFLYMRALSAEPLDRLDSLEQDLRRILSFEPSHTAALNALGYTLIDRTDRIDEAAPMIEQAYAQNPNSFAITDSLGWLRFKQGRYDEAVNLLAQALAMQDETLDDDEVVSHYVEALWRNGQYDKAQSVANDWLARFTATDRLEALLKKLGLNN